MKIDFKHKLKSEIKIKALETLGIVIGHYNGEGGIQYQVAYFVDGSRKVAYLFPEEIANPDKESNLGFKT